MLYTFGKILFPKMLHREKALRARMAWVAGGAGLLIITLVVVLMNYVHDPRLSYRKQVTPLPVHASPQSR